MTESQLAYTLLRAAIDGSQTKLGNEAISIERWRSLFRLMQRNHVCALCHETVAAAGAPREVLMPWLSETGKTIDRHLYQQRVQEDIIQHMQSHGIRTLVLKGTHVAQYYPRPELRKFGDLDLYFFDRHKDADAVARKELGVSISNDSHHHTKYDYKGVTVESHYDFLNIHYPPSNRKLETWLKKEAPTPTFEVVFLLRHMAIHFASSRITLRDLVDWTLTCRALQDKVDWTVVQCKVEEYGMGSFAAALNSVADKQLGYHSPLTSPHYGPHKIENMRLFEQDIIYGTPETDDSGRDGIARLPWKLRRWKAQAWKRRMVFCDSEPTLLWSSLASHAEKPRSILHKM